MRATRRLLVVDDDLDLGEYITATARQMGHTCRHTTSVHDLLTVPGDDADLLLLDLLMPEVDGVQVLRHLAARGCTTPIVLMSGVGRRVMETTRELAEALGLTVAHTMQKPFPHSELRAVIERSHGVVHRAPPAQARRLEVTEQELLTALAEREFCTFYQPQIDIATGRVSGLEALVRWQHPSAGLVYPDTFLPVLESMGEMDAMGWQVFQSALTDLPLFASAEGELPAISLNCTVDSLTDLRFPDRLLELAAQAGVPAQKITLEITESGLLRELDKTLDVLARLRMKGVQLSVDDFGTGYSMMRQLRHIPATEIKIDKFFVQHLDSGSGDGVIIRKTIEMGQELGLRVVAEGVETPEQLAFLQAARCDVAQGYLFSRPISRTDLLGWLRERRPGSLEVTGRRGPRRYAA